MEVGTDSQNCKVPVIDKVKMKKRKKEEKKSNGECDVSLLLGENVPDNVECGIQSTKCDGNAPKEIKRKKKYKKDENLKDNSSAAQQASVDKDTTSLLHTAEIQNNEVEYANKGKKKRSRLVGNGTSDGARDDEVEHDNKREKKKTRVVGNKEVISSVPQLDDSFTEEQKHEEENVVRGKRFTHEEDKIIKESVCKYILDHNLGDEGLNMVLNCRKHPEVKGCWKEIWSALPYRPHRSVYDRAQILFRRSETRKWTQEEKDEILKHVEKHGTEWKALADKLGKHSMHVSYTWRRIKLRHKKRGHWSQEEYQRLFDLVNADLQLKVSKPKRSKHGMLRDNIQWTAISDELSTRTDASCCLKWYKQLTSPMVAEGVWVDADDYCLIGALYELDATCLEDVDWDDLVDGRSGDVCRKRWNQMAVHIGRYKSFGEQVEVLAQRYCPDLVEVREAWDSKPRVP